MAAAESDYNKAVARALDILALRSHTAFELRHKLCRNFDADIAEAAVARMAELGYLNDLDFAERYAAELVERKGLGLRLAKARLCARGVSAESAEQVLAPYVNEQGETARITALIEKKYPAKLQEPNGAVRVFGALLRRGFAAEDIRAALRELGMRSEA